MAVRYRPRGFQARPGTRLSYWFENSVTEEKGIPPKHSGAFLHGCGRDRDGFTEVRVTFDNGHTTVAPLALFGPEGESLEDNRRLGRGYPAGYFGGDRRPEWEREDAEYERQYKAYPINPDLLDRAVARFGPRENWVKAQRQAQAAHERWMKRWHPNYYAKYYGGG